MRLNRCYKKGLLHFCLAGLLFISCASFAQQVKVLTLKQLTDSIQSIVNTDHMPGLMLGITSRDSVIFSGGFGFADVKATRPSNETTLFRMGSITKMFISMSVLKLIEQGRLNLNDELKKVAPEVPFTNKWEATHPVRIVNLLEHTAGFDDMKLNRMCSQDTIEYKGKESMLMQSPSLVSRWQPGERFAYSNPGYVVLGYIIEKITGKPYDAYITENILQPLGMVHTNFNLRSKWPAQETRQYVVHGGKIIEVPSVTVIMGAAGSLWSCSGDMVKFLQLFLRNGQPLFADSILQQMETVHSSLAARSGLASGYGLANTSMFLYSKYPWRGHGGLMGTCFSTFAYNRQLGLGFVLSSNGNQPNFRIERIITEFLEQQAPEKKLDTIVTDLTVIRSFAGQYQFANPRIEMSSVKDKLLNTLEVYIDNNSVYVKSLSGDKIRLVQTAPFHFAREGANAATVVFTKNEAGGHVMIMDGAYYEQAPYLKVKPPFWLAVIAIIFAVLSVPVAAISLIGFAAGRVKKDKLLLRVLPGLSVLLLVWALINVFQVQDESYLLSELTTINKRTIIIFTGSLLFGLFSLLHPVMVLRRFNQFSHRWFACYWLITALAVFYIALILFQNGWIGLRTWAM